MMPVLVMLLLGGAFPMIPLSVLIDRPSECRAGLIVDMRDDGPIFRNLTHHLVPKRTAEGGYSHGATVPIGNYMMRCYQREWWEGYLP